MRTSCVKNGLVLGVILLFIGVVFQPSVAVNPISSDNEEDCDICPKVSNQHLVRLRSLIDKVETLNNDISLMSRLNPEVVEKYQELSDRIWSFPISCGILKILANFGEKVGYELWNFVLTLDNFPKILGHIAMSIIAIGYISLMLGWVIGCWDWIIPDWLEYA